MLARSFGDKLHRTVVFVAHPTYQAEPLGFTPGEMPKPNALHAPHHTGDQILLYRIRHKPSDVQIEKMKRERRLVQQTLATRPVAEAFDELLKRLHRKKDVLEVPDVVVLLYHPVCVER